MNIARSFTLSLCAFLFATLVKAETQAPGPTIGYIGSLSGFAAEYGTAVLEGVQLALDESSPRATLVVEDDQSSIPMATSAYTKLRTVNKIQGLLAGSWWVRPVAPLAQRDQIPFLSLETLKDKDFEFHPAYFVGSGDLRDWVRVFQPLLKERGLKRAAIIRFNSGFAQTIAAEISAIMGELGGSVVIDLEYSELDLPAAATYVARVKQAKPDFLYLDAQPESHVTILKRVAEQKLEALPIFGNSTLEVACSMSPDACSKHQEIFFNRRRTLSTEFATSFSKKFGRPPHLNSDLGYYGAKMLLEALQKPNPIQALGAISLPVPGGGALTFSQDHVLQGLVQEVWSIRAGVSRQKL